MLPLKNLIFGLSLLFLSSGVLSQQKTVIHVERAKQQLFDKRFGADIERLIGDVVLRQDSTWFYCDSAYLNEKNRNFDAFGNVHIKVSDTLHIYGDKLKYNGERKEAELFDNVRLLDDSTVLETEYLIYYRVTRLAYYPDRGVITNGENILKSKKGYYQTNKKEFYFSQDVELINPEYITYTDTMVYNTITEKAFFFTPTLIRGEENTIYAESGWYDTGLDIAEMQKNAQLTTKDQLVESDWIFYNRNTGFGDARGNVVITDTTHKLIVKGDIGKLWEDEGRSFVTGEALGISYDTKDSLYLHADTLFMFFDKEKQAKQMKAYFGVRFFRADLQGTCDSLVYHMSDSTLRMYKLPVLWSAKNQLTADSIFIAITNQELDSLIMYNSAFIVSRDSLEGYNQIKGKNMVGHFLDNELDNIFVDGNAQTVYWVREDDKRLIGINLAKSSTMLIRLEDNAIKGISYFSGPTETMYPEKDLPKAEAILRGFQWLEQQRPTDKNDIFRKIEPKLPEADTTKKAVAVPKKD
jgi:lipopolysaccharide export system protein LptA